MTGRKLIITWFYFAAGIVYLAISCVIIAFTINYYSLFSLLTLWPALCSFYMFLACFANNPHMLGKNPKTGKIDKSMIIMLFPLFFLLWMYWLARKSSTKERIYDEIVPGIYLGMLPFLLPKSDLRSAPEKHKENLPLNVGMIIDCTAEFNQPITDTKYHCLLALDGMHLPETVANDVFVALREVSAWDTQKNGAILVHCAEGHARSPTMLAMILVVKGVARDFDEAYNLIKSKRNKVNMKPHQRAVGLKLLERYKTSKMEV